MKWWQHIFCSWSKWITSKHGTIQRPDHTGHAAVTVGYWVQQERVCEICSKVELRTTSSY